MSFKIGDIVRLRSGGPLMTICGLDPGGKVVGCFWFSQESELRSANFIIETLKVPEKHQAPRIVAKDAPRQPTVVS